MSQVILTDFLKTCGFKEDVFADVLFKLTDEGIDSVEILLELTIEDLQSIKLSKV